MANLKEVRNRIASVNSTQQITKAMKMVSAAKLRRAQDAILTMRPYAAKLREIMENISARSKAARAAISPAYVRWRRCSSLPSIPTVACAALSMPTSTVRSTDSFARPTRSRLKKVM